MKKFMFSLLAVAAVAACSKAPQENVELNSAPEESGAPEQVLLSTNVKATVEAKSQGGVDAWDATQNLHIYAYQRVAGGVDYTTATPLINNVLAVSPAAGQPDNTIGVYKPGTSEPYFYEGSRTYDFYGFYVDDLAVTPRAENNALYVPLEISGGEDVMVAQADPQTDYNNAVTNGLFTGDAASWNVRYAYSAYAARRGVHPSLKFEHQLARFRFYIKSGSDFDVTGTDDNLVVKGLSMKSQYKADLCVAGGQQGLVNVVSETKGLVLCSFDPENKKLVDLIPYEVPDKDVVIEDESNLLGESLMVIPGAASYEIELVMSQSGNENKLPVTLNITDVKDDEDNRVNQNYFQKGYSYKVYITVVGLAEAIISAELEPWTAGGRIDIDSDSAPEVIE